MATKNVPMVNPSLLNLASVDNAQKTLKENRDREEAAARKRYIPDAVKISTASNKPGVATSGEPARPHKPTPSSHANIQAARSELQKALVSAGVKFPGGDVDLESLALAQAETLQNNIDKLLEQRAPEARVAKEEAKREALLGALYKFQKAHVEAGAETGETPEVETASASEGADADPKQMSEEEQNLWTQMAAQLKTVGIDLGGEERNVDEVQKKFLTRVGSEFAQLQEKATGLNSKYQELLTQYKKETDPKAKMAFEKSLNEIKSVLGQINQRQMDLKTLVTNFGVTSDALLSYHVSHELGLAQKKATKSAKVQSASVKNESSPTGSPTQKTPKPDDSQAGLSVQSAGGGSTESVSGGTEGVHPEGQHAPLLDTSSATGDSYVSPDVALARTASTDLTGTTTTIGQTGANSRAEAGRLDKLIKKLILAAQSGNMDAVVSGLIFLSKRANILTTSMGAQTLIAMQQYEKQMGVISNQIGALKPSATYSSNLAKLNADMSIYSSARQQIVQTFQSTLSMKEQADELPHSVIQKLGQLGSRLASFQ